MNREVAAALSLYGAAHLVVDAVCAAAVMQLPVMQTVPSGDFIALLLLYHVLAFGLQPLFGLAIDAARTPLAAAVAGCLVSTAALCLSTLPLLAVMVAGIGNAAFHVGGYVICGRTSPRRATIAGLFVAPGSIGLLLGVVLGMKGPTATWPLLPVGLVVCALMARVPCLLSERSETAGMFAGASCPRQARAWHPSVMVPYAELVLALVLLSIAVRALLGFLIEVPWQTQPGLLIVLTLATVAGKALGGIVADRWGWLRIGVGATLAALPFLAWGPAHPMAAIPGVLLLNMTMPVTLAATVEALPGHPGFAFGLTCLALLFGIMPAMLGISLSSPAIVAAVVLISAAALYYGLRMLPIAGACRQTIEVRP